MKKILVPILMLVGSAGAADFVEDAATVNDFLDLLQISEDNARQGKIVEWDAYMNDRGEQVCYYSMDLEYDSDGNPIKILNLYNYFDPDTKEINLIGVDILHPEGDKWIIDDVFVSYLDGGKIYVELQDADGNLVEGAYKKWSSKKGFAKFLNAPYCGE